VTTATIAREAARRTASLDRQQALALRREALLTLDRAVRTLIERRLPVARYGTPVALDHTVYDQLYPALGGHWTIAYRRPLGLMHTISSLTIALEFDREQRPVAFRVAGAIAVKSRDASLESLDAALGTVLSAGLLTTSAPSFMPGFAL